MLSRLIEIKSCAIKVLQDLNLRDPVELNHKKRQDLETVILFFETIIFILCYFIQKTIIVQIFPNFPKITLEISNRRNPLL